MITNLLLWVGICWFKNPLSWIVLTGVLKYWEYIFSQAQHLMTTKEIIEMHFWLENIKAEHFFYWSKA